MELALSDWIDQHIFATGNFEDYTAFVIRSLLQEGQTFIDIGANVGFFSLLAASVVGNEGMVLAFEPGPSQRLRMEKNIVLNHLSNVTISDAALSDENGKSTFFLGPPSNSGRSSLLVSSSEACEIVVRTARFDDIWDYPKPIHLVKIDVEGSELRVLRGMQQCIQDFHPDIIVEVTDTFLSDTGESVGILFDLLTDHGYRMYLIDWDNITPVQKLHKSLPNQFNALFTVRDTLPSCLNQKSGKLDAI